CHTFSRIQVSCSALSGLHCGPHLNRISSHLLGQSQPALLLCNSRASLRSSYKVLHKHIHKMDEAFLGGNFPIEFRVGLETECLWVEHHLDIIRDSVPDHFVALMFVYVGSFLSNPHNYTSIRCHHLVMSGCHRPGLSCRFAFKQMVLTPGMVVYVLEQRAAIHYVEELCSSAYANLHLAQVPKVTLDVLLVSARGEVGVRVCCLAVQLWIDITAASKDNHISQHLINLFPT